MVEKKQKVEVTHGHDGRIWRESKEVPVISFDEAKQALVEQLAGFAPAEVEEGGVSLELFYVDNGDGRHLLISSDSDSENRGPGGMARFKASILAAETPLDFCGEITTVQAVTVTGLDPDLFGRVNPAGDVEIFTDPDGERVTVLPGFDLWPVNSEFGAGYEHPEGLVISLEEARRIGLRLDGKTQDQYYPRVGQDWS